MAVTMIQAYYKVEELAYGMQDLLYDKYGDQENESVMLAETIVSEVEALYPKLDRNSTVYSSLEVSFCELAYYMAISQPTISTYINNIISMYHKLEVIESV